MLLGIVLFGPAGGAGRGGAAVRPDAETLQARVVEVLSERDRKSERFEEPLQVVRVEITGGSQKGRSVEIDYGAHMVMAESSRVRQGDEVLLEYSAGGPVGEYFAISDFVRLPAILGLGLLFAVVTILVGRWVGLRSLISIGMSVLALAAFIIPGIMTGHDPLLVSLVGSLLLMGGSLYLIYEWQQKTHTAFAGVTISLLLAAILAIISTNVLRLTGLGSEDAGFLLQSLPIPVDLRSLLLAGIIIGSVGVLDDVTVGQSSAIFELHKANPQLPWRALYHHGMVIGRDHIASMVNTLLLAYAGAALPLFLLLNMQSTSLGQMLNREFLAEEIVRTLVGSIGLILAVPITSLIAALVAERTRGARTRSLTWAHGPLNFSRKASSPARTCSAE